MFGEHRKAESFLSGSVDKKIHFLTVSKKHFDAFFLNKKIKILKSIKLKLIKIISKLDFRHFAILNVLYMVLKQEIDE
jgi:hypothetical protein